MNAENQILALLNGLAGDIGEFKTRLEALETRSQQTAAGQTTPGDDTRAQTKTRAPAAANIHPETRTPVVPGTRRNPTETPAICLAATRGEKVTPKGTVYYNRAVTCHFGGSSTVSAIIGGRSNSTRKPDDTRTPEELVTETPAWQFLRMTRNNATYWFTPEDEPGQPRTAATQTTLTDFAAALADSILWICVIKPDDDAGRAKIARTIAEQHFGPTAAPAKKGKTKT